MTKTITEREDREHRSVTPVAHLVRVLDYERPRDAGARHRVHDLDEVILGRGDSAAVRRTERTLELDIPDARMSSRHARVVRDGEHYMIEDLGSRNGTFVDGRRVDMVALDDGAIIELGRTAYVMRMLEPIGAADVDADQLASPVALPTFSPAFARQLASAAKVALTTQSILLHGDTGTGKEVLARGLHAASRRAGPFVAVNCGALPDNLVESELFGSRKGAFSGATEDRPGLVRAAHAGTLFLDEIGDLPLATQAALLRVLQEREVMPIGGTKPIAVDLRVIAASHRDLEAEVTAGRFREDLLARLAGYTIAIPSLRDRREDLGLLVAALLAKQGANVRFARDAGFALLRCDWRRNVRELEQVLGSAVALAVDGLVELAHLPPALQSGQAPKPLDLSPSEVAKRDELRAALAKHQGNIAAAGRELGVARMQIHRWLERFGLDIDEFRH